MSGWFASPLSPVELLGLFFHFLLLGLIAVGGVITTAPDMQRYVVVEQGWISAEQFSASIAIAQAAPGPNILFVAAIGWNVAGPAGALVTMAAVLLPSTLLSVAVSRWGLRHRETRGVRAFTTGLTPITIGLLIATGWVLTAPYLADPARRWGALALVVASAAAILYTRVGPMWLIAMGAVAGGLGWA